MAAFIIVDDHPLVRLAIRLLLEKEGHEVVAEVDDCYNIIEIVRIHQADALVMDIDLPGINGIDAIITLRSQKIHIPIIVMSHMNSDYYAEQSMKAGANGFICKQHNLSELSNAVKALFSGYGYFPLRMNHSYSSPSANPDAERLRMLTRREFEVLRSFGASLSISDIAQQMNISNKTVSTFKARLLQKLSLKSLPELLAFAKRNNIS